MIITRIGEKTILRLKGYEEKLFTKGLEAIYNAKATGGAAWPKADINMAIEVSSRIGMFKEGERSKLILVRQETALLVKGLRAYGQGDLGEDTKGKVKILEYLLDYFQTVEYMDVGRF